MKVKRSQLQKLLCRANSRLQGSVISLDELCDRICNHSAKSTFSRFKNTLVEHGTIDKGELRKLMCAMWVLHNLGLIAFSKKADGLAITVQEMLLQDKRIIASRLMSVIEDMFDSVSDDAVSITEE